MKRVCLLGAESTGKTRLSQELATHYRDQGRHAVVVPEYLREWCEREGRTPRPDEQEGIAREQARRIEAAGPAEWVITDAGPLMVAVYSDLLFGDRSLYPFALAQQRAQDVTLLTGLDLPWVADGFIRDGAHAREPVDALARAALAGARLPFRVVYGHGPERLASALSAIDSVARSPRSMRVAGVFDASSSRAGWTWACEKCSDPDCEHRLLSQLLAKKSGD